MEYSWITFKFLVFLRPLKCLFFLTHTADYNASPGTKGIHETRSTYTHLNLLHFFLLLVEEMDNYKEWKLQSSSEIPWLVDKYYKNDSSF